MGTYGEIAMDIFKEIALGVLRHSKSWKAKIASMTTDTVISTREICKFTKEFCLKIKEQFDKKKDSSSQDEDNKIINNSDEIVNEIMDLITVQVTEKIYGLIMHLTDKYVNTFVVNPVMNKVWSQVWSFGEGAKKRVEFEEFSEEREKIKSFYDILEA
jgi:hypothetical protein